MFLHHILTREPSALITQVFWAQVDQPVKGDWCLVVKEDLDTIGLGHLSFETIKKYEQDTLHELVKARIKETAFINLLSDKEKCSKLKSLKYTGLSIQPYLTSESNLSISEKQILFRWRSHMINVKQNQGKRDAKCPLCKEADDTQYHLLTCSLLNAPQPWNIQSVMKALRQREVLIEKENKKSDKTSN